MKKYFAWGGILSLFVGIVYWYVYIDRDFAIDFLDAHNQNTVTISQVLNLHDIDKEDVDTVQICAQPIGTECETNSDCTSGNCSGGYCQACQNSGYSCSDTGQCCDEDCSSGVCGGTTTCALTGAPCTEGTQCCTGYCDNEICTAASCTGNGNACTSGSECCSNYCVNNLCSCASNGTSCTTTAQCCSGYCSNNVCTCADNGATCSTNSGCCSNYCASGICTASSSSGSSSTNDFDIYSEVIYPVASAAGTAATGLVTQYIGSKVYDAFAKEADKLTGLEDKTGDNNIESTIEESGEADDLAERDLVNNFANWNNPGINAIDNNPGLNKTDVVSKLQKAGIDEDFLDNYETYLSENNLQPNEASLEDYLDSLEWSTDDIQTTLDEYGEDILNYMADNQAAIEEAGEDLAAAEANPAVDTTEGELVLDLVGAGS